MAVIDVKVLPDVNGKDGGIRVPVHTHSQGQHDYSGVGLMKH